MGIKHDGNNWGRKIMITIISYCCILERVEHVQSTPTETTAATDRTRLEFSWRSQSDLVNPNLKNRFRSVSYSRVHLWISRWRSSMVLTNWRSRKRREIEEMDEWHWRIEEVTHGINRGIEVEEKEGKEEELGEGGDHGVKELDEG